MSNFDVFVKNFAPHTERLKINIEEWEVNVYRAVDGEIKVEVYDSFEGSRTIYTLGETGETQLV